MEASIDSDLRRAREAVLAAHSAAETAHDLDAVIATFHHPRYEIVPTGDVHDGPEAVMAYFKETRTAFPDQRNELIALHQADDAVIAEFNLKGTHQGPLRGFEPTGKEFTCRMIAVFEFEPEGDGIVCERVYFDSGTILAQLAS